MKKVIFTTVRTLLAIVIIAVAVLVIVRAYNWQTWCPNNDLGFLVVSMMWVWGISAIIGGLYGISPIFWQVVIGLIGKRIFDDDNYIRDARRQIRRLSKTWSW